MAALHAEAMLSLRAYEIVSSLVATLMQGAAAAIALISALIAVAALVF
jgi:hypothetical protein